MEESDYSDLQPAMSLSVFRQHLPGLGRDLAYAIAKAIGIKAGSRWLLPRARVIDFLEGRVVVAGKPGTRQAQDPNR